MLRTSNPVPASIQSTRHFDAWMRFHHEKDPSEMQFRDPLWANEDVELDYERKDREPDQTYIPWLKTRLRKPAVNEYTYWTDKMGYDTRLLARQTSAANAPGDGNIYTTDQHRFADGKALPPLPSIAHFPNTRHLEQKDRFYASGNPNLPYTHHELGRPLGSDFYERAKF